MLNSDNANIQDKILPIIMPRIRVNRFNFYFIQSVGLSGLPKLGRTKVTCDNLESSKVRGTGVLRRSSAIAVEIGLF